MSKVSVSTRTDAATDAVPDPTGKLMYRAQCKDWLPVDSFACGKHRY
jgi:hypothetical protein